MSTEITSDIRKKAIASAPETVLALYGDLDLGDLIYQICESLCMNDERRKSFTHIIGDIILGIIPENEFVTLVEHEMGISATKAQQIKMSLDAFFRKVAIAHTGISQAQIPQANNVLKEKLELRPEGVPRPATPLAAVTPLAQTPNDPNRPLTREEVLQSLAPRRTMASDIESIQHQSSPTVDTPRWGSE